MPKLKINLWKFGNVANDDMNGNSAEVVLNYDCRNDLSAETICEIPTIQQDGDDEDNALHFKTFGYLIASCVVISIGEVLGLSQSI